MNKISKTVSEASNRLYATMATAMAARAVSAAKAGTAKEADTCAEFAIGWLQKAGANATTYHYSTPRA